MSDVFDCFLNRREVSQQEPGQEFLALQELANEALCGGEAERAFARAVILDVLQDMWRDGMSYREHAEAARMVGLLRSLGVGGGGLT